MNTPTDKQVRDWYMGYGVEGRAELADVEGDAFDRYLAEHDARIAKETEQRIIKLLENKREEHIPWCGVAHCDKCEQTIGIEKAINTIMSEAKTNE